MGIASLLAAGAWHAVGAAEAPPVLAIAVDAKQIVVTGVTPKQRVAVFGVGQVVEGFGVTTARRTEVLEDTDGDGVVSFTAATPIPVRSVWFAIDLAKGTAAEGHPAEFLATERELPSGAPTAVRSSLPFVVGELLLARQNLGVWNAHVVDGYAGDKDGKPDGLIDLSLDSLRTSGDGPAKPSQLQANDTIIAVDPVTLEYVVTRVR